MGVMSGNIAALLIYLVVGGGGAWVCTMIALTKLDALNAAVSKAPAGTGYLERTMGRLPGGGAISLEREASEPLPPTSPQGATLDEAPAEAIVNPGEPGKKQAEGHPKGRGGTRQLIWAACVVLLILLALLIRARIAGPKRSTSGGTTQTVSSDNASPNPRPPSSSTAQLLAPQCDATVAPKAGTQDIQVTTSDGVKHIVSNYSEDRQLQGSGTPWDDAVALDRDYPALRTLIAIDLHPSEDKSGGYTRHEPPLTSAVLLIPISAMADVAFKRAGDQGTVSSVCLAGGESFIAGEGFGHLVGREDLRSLGTANFESWVGDIADLKAVSPVPFKANFEYFGVHQTPFGADFVDTAGAHIALTKALFVDVGMDNGYDSIVFSSNLKATKGKATNLSIPFSKIGAIKLEKTSDDGYGAQLTLRTGELSDITILSSKGMILPSSGILGSSSKGWVWVPWSVVTDVEIRGAS